ncbi:MAG: sigma-54 dependent transcriptional regulator [Desulfobacterales bacterium]
MNSIYRMIDKVGFARTLVEHLPCGMLILDGQAQVVATNGQMDNILGPKAQIQGQGAGQHLGCIYAMDASAGCVARGECQECEMRILVRTAVAKEKTIRDQVTMELLVDQCLKTITLDLNIVPFDYEAQRYALMLIWDISPLKPVPDQSPASGFRGIIGRTPQMRALFDSIRKVAATDASVLIQGESGTGKELVAQAIHKESHRRSAPFIPFNSGALPDGLVESELFGHEKGAFTGAMREKKGRFELARGGTLFLDEVAELSPAVQIKLLRVLQEGTFERVGGEKTLQSDVRIVSATNKNLAREVEAGRFRRDLYYRLCVMPLTTPPLRTRQSDIPRLCAHFLREYAAEAIKERVKLSPATLSILIHFGWPGNVRELQNVLQFALINCPDTTIEPRHLPLNLLEDRHFASAVRKRRVLNAREVSEALQQSQGNKLKAAQLLGVSRSTLYRFFQKQSSGFVQ